MTAAAYCWRSQPGANSKRINYSDLGLSNWPVQTPIALRATSQRSGCDFMWVYLVAILMTVLVIFLLFAATAVGMHSAGVIGAECYRNTFCSIRLSSILNKVTVELSDYVMIIIRI